jgi:hypothetical protein
MLSAKNFSIEPTKITIDGDEYSEDSQTRLKISDFNSPLTVTFNGTRTYMANGQPFDSDNDN